MSTTGSRGGSHRNGRIRVLAGTLAERFRTSLFGLPSLWVGASVLLWALMRWIDGSIDAESAPGSLVTTVDSARALLSAVASGTITAASVVFSLTLVAIQLSSSTYSSRVVRTFMRDRFQQNMIGIVVGTFFYSLLVLRDVRGPLEDGGDAYVPGASVVLATVLALVAILALLASISHTAMSVRVSHVSASVLRDTRAVIRDRLGSDGPDGRLDLQAPGVVPSPLPVATGSGEGSVAAGAGEGSAATGSGDGAVATGSGDGSEPNDAHALVVDSGSSGWVQQVGVDAIAAALPEGSVVELQVAVGTYVFEGGPLATVSLPTEGDRPTEAGPDEDRPERDDLVAALLAAFTVGRERTMQQDVALGLTMLEDIALRALSPGVNDPNTARAVIPQLGDLLVEILSRDPNPSTVEVSGVTIRRSAAPTYLDYTEAAFGQIRRLSHDQPEVRLTLVRTVASVAAELQRRGRATPGAMEALVATMGRLAPPPAGDTADPGAPRGSASPDAPRGALPGTWSDPDDPAVVAARDLLAASAWYSPAVVRERPVTGA